MPMIHLMSIVLVPALLLRANGSYSNTHWTERNMTWLNSDNDSDFKLRLCASRENELMCGNFTWQLDNQYHCSKSVCTVTINSSKSKTSFNYLSRYFNCLHDNTVPCNSQFYQVWNDYPTCKCISESTKGETTSYITTSASATTPVTHYNDANSAQISKILAILVALLTVLIMLMIIGWVWTCWMVKKLKKHIESSQTSRYV